VPIPQRIKESWLSYTGLMQAGLNAEGKKLLDEKA